ncbi:MAG TPA: response regulator transcription factor [Bryobacteraceae bacterium]|nr:response regulator transcription factor [Bryobacteraceae bacterium]
MEEQATKRIAICDTQPVTAEGLRVLLDSAPGFEFIDWAETLQVGTTLGRAGKVDLLIVDKAFGTHAVLDWLRDLRSIESSPSVIVWGVSMTEAEALRFLQAGASGIVRKSAGLRVLISCIQTVAAGRTWMEDNVFRDGIRPDRYPHSELTPREQQVLELVEQGFKNKEIARELGIRPGTVKIHLKHIFEKTGVRGRYGLALSGLKGRGVVSLAS